MKKTAPTPATVRLGAAATLALLAGALTSGAHASSVSFTGLYTQDFDGLNQTGAQTITGRGPHPFSALTSLTISGMDGWYFAQPGGSSSNTEFRAQDGSLAGSGGRGVISFGTAGSPDRALGALATSNQISSFGVLLTNNTGADIPGIVISYTGEQWRAGDANLVNKLGFLYGFGSSIDSAATAFSALDFVTPNLAGGQIALDGNLPANQQQLTATILFNWAAGQTLALRWNGQDLQGQDNGLAIDNLRIQVVPVPGAAWLLVSGLGALGWARRRAS
jgi:hypothetical protein